MSSIFRKTFFYDRYFLNRLCDTSKSKEILTKIGKEFTNSIPKEFLATFPIQEGDQIKLIQKKTHIEVHFVDFTPHKTLAKLLKDVDYRSDESKIQTEEFLSDELEA